MLIVCIGIITQVCIASCVINLLNETTDVYRGRGESEYDRIEKANFNVTFEFVIACNTLL